MNAKNNKKILFYISTIREGGAARVMVNLANQFCKENYKVIFVTNFPDKNEYILDKKIKRISIEEKEFTGNCLIKNFTRIRVLRLLIKSHKPEYAISFMAENNFRLILSNLFTTTKSIISIRTDPKRKYRSFKGFFLGKVLYRLANGIVFQTKEAQDFFPKAIQEKSAIIFNPVADNFYRIIRSKQPQNIITCGRLSIAKRQELLIKAFSHLVNKFPQENLLIYGEGKQKKYLEEWIAKLNLQNRVFLMGQSNNIAEILSQAKVFVLSSDYEGMPNALMEAMAVGVPSVSTDCPCGGPRDLIKDGQNGLLVPCNNEKKLTLAMEKLLSQPEQAKQIGAKAREFAQKFATPFIFKQWKKYFDSITPNNNKLKKKRAFFDAKSNK